MTDKEEKMHEATNWTSKDGKTWTPSEPLPYYPGLLESLLHRLGRHLWDYTDRPKCVICGKKKQEFAA